MTDPTPATFQSPGPRRIQAVVALRLLEVMRDMDLPVEIFEAEDPTQTMPRRFGLSDVVERQIRSYKEDGRRRLSDDEVHGLFRFVIRRPDGAEVFHEVGRLLAHGDGTKRWVRLLPMSVQYRVARSRARRRLKRLFGRRVGGFERAPFIIEGRSLLFIESDPGGDACHLLSGFAEQILEQTLGGRARVTHTRCQGMGDDRCRWEGELVKAAATVVDLPDTSEESPVVENGTVAPDFTLDSDDNGPISLSDLRGRRVVLYFYPKDDTPGCTIQACDFRDSLPRFEGVDAVVLGVSADTVESHRAFREKFDLNFSLLADIGGEISELYGVWGERSVRGGVVMGIERSTFLIDEDGVVSGVWRNVDPQGHMQMLAELLEG